MSTHRSKSRTFGDYIFRRPYLDMSPDEIRRHLDRQTRDRIRKSLSSVSGPRECGWPWLASPARS